MAADDPKIQSFLQTIEDESLRMLFTDVANYKDYKVVKLGMMALPQFVDKVAALEAVRNSINNILDDFAEHGNDNVDWLYEGNTKEYFEEKKAEVEKQLKEYLDAGERSDLFSRYQSARKTA